MKIFNTVTSGLLLLLLVSPLKASQTIHHQNIWSLAGLNLNVGNFSYQFEPQLRTRNQPVEYYQSVTNLGGGYNLSAAWALWLGGTWVDTAQQSPSAINKEYRIWQQILYRQPMPFLNFTLRSRFEQRKRLNIEHWNYRIRNRFILSKPLTSSINLIAYDELFVLFNKPAWINTNTIEQNRIMLGFNQRASKWLLLEVGYLYQQFFSKPRQDNYAVTLNAQLFFSC